MAQLHFLPVKTVKSQQKPKRESELEISEIRAHAARISHRHAAARGQVRRLPTSTVTKIPSLPSPLAAAAVHSGTLDPFLALPLTLDSHERYLLQLYLGTMGKAVYRLGENPVYCPMRDAVAAEIASNALVIRWVVYLSGVATGALNMFILARRANLYAEMLKMLKSNPLDDLGCTLMVLLSAACCEFQCGDLALAYKHWVGVLALAKGHLGGLRAVQKINFARAMALVEGVLSLHVPLFETKPKLFEAMDTLSIPIAKVPIDRRVRKFFSSDVQGWSEKDVAFHIANLHLVSMISEHEEYGKFMKEFVKLMLGGSEEITPTGVMFLICQSAVRIGEWYGEAPKLRVWGTLEFTRLIMLTMWSREAVIRAMSASLLGRPRSFEREHPALDLKVIKREIAEGWDIIHGAWDAVAAGSPSSPSSINDGLLALEWNESDK